jgi:hypothetical protein
MLSITRQCYSIMSFFRRHGCPAHCQRRPTPSRTGHRNGGPSGSETPRSASETPRSGSHALLHTHGSSKRRTINWRVYGVVFALPWRLIGALLLRLRSFRQPLGLRGAPDEQPLWTPQLARTSQRVEKRACARAARTRRAQVRVRRRTRAVRRALESSATKSSRAIALAQPRSVEMSGLL